MVDFALVRTELGTLQDQEVLVRHMHKVAHEWVDDYKKQQHAEV